MGQIVTLGSTNVASLNVPQVLVQVVPPQVLFGGVATNVGGLVGTACWGPVNSPQAAGNTAQFAQVFGPTVNRLYDMGGHAQLAYAQGASFLYGVRVTDGTDVASSIAIASTAAVKASTTFTESTTKDFLATDTMTIGNQTFQFVSSIGSAPGNILVQANTNAGFALAMAAIIASMAASISGGPATATYVPNTTPSNVSGSIASGNGLTTAQTVIFTALAGGTAGNSLSTTYTATGGTSAGSFTSTTMAGGAAAIVGVTITAKYTGSLGNNLFATLSSGSKANTFKVVISMKGFSPEVFDNIAGTGNALWLAIAAAINNGNSTVRGPSNLAIASAGVGTAAPASAATTFALTGGTDGATTITTSVLVGTDVVPRTGMYCLRNTAVSKAMICDLSDSTSFSTQLALASDIACEFIMCTAAGDTISNADTELQTAGIDDFNVSCLFGDWVYFLDSLNGVPMRLISPQSCKLGILCALSPEESALNKEIKGIIGTQRSLSGIPYSTSDLQILGSSGMDAIGQNAEVGTTYFACMFGKNTSSNQVTQDDSYTQLTYFIARSLLKIGAPYIGQTQTPKERRQAKISINSFLANLEFLDIIGNADGTQPYQTTLDDTNNPQSMVAIGFQFAYVAVQYFGIVRYFVFNLEGGSSVQIAINDNDPQTSALAA